MKFPLHKNWRYDQHFFIAEIKRNKWAWPNDHERRPFDEKLANKESWIEVNTIMDAQANPCKEMDKVFPTP
jgi:hypothetical protein